MQDLGNRATYIGGSDIAVILGLSPFATRESLLREKITGESKRFYSWAMKFGHQYESAIINGDAFMEDYTIIPPEAGKEQHEVKSQIDGFDIICHLDGIGEQNGEKFLIECKTGSTPFGGKLPDYYNCQVQWYMHFANLNKCRICFGQRMPDGSLGNQEGFWVKKEDGWYDSILPEIIAFIADIRKGEVPPEFIPAPMEDAQIAEYLNIVQIYEQAEQFIDSFRKVLAEKMEESGIKKCYLGGFCASLTADSETTSFDSVKFKKENPELAEKYQKTIHRKGGLRLTKTKKGE